MSWYCKGSYWMSDEFNTGVQRRRIEDSIVERFRQVDFNQKKHAYLEEDHFWDFVFSWYELARYYELSGDTAVGAHMLELFAQCGQKFREAATDRDLRERRRDKAADALYQITYYVNQMMTQVQRNAIEKESAVGEINWKDAPKDDDGGSRLN